MMKEGMSTVECVSGYVALGPGGVVAPINSQTLPICRTVQYINFLVTQDKKGQSEIDVQINKGFKHFFQN